MASKKPRIFFINLIEDLEIFLKFVVAILILGFILHSGSVFETSYPSRFVELYALPWWRFFIVLLVVIGAWWCPRVGIVLALAAFFYLNDMRSLTSPFLVQ
jgi:hypothetical protein